MKKYWERIRTVVDDMSLRERAMVFIAAAFVVISLMEVLLLDPLLAKQKILSTQVIQQQERMKEMQAQMQNLLQAKRDEEHSPLRERMAQLKQQLLEQDSYLQSRRDRLVEPDKMADLLKQVLNKNGRLQLVELKTLPVSLLVEKPQGADAAGQTAPASVPDGQRQADTQKQIFKHGVQITVRGGYLDLVRYVTALEKLPAQMFWGEASLSVEKYPDGLFTLTVYTLSLDKTWLTV
jgi:MSHA biogenesis protein MshJ